MPKLGKLDVLEEKVAQTTEKFETLSARCQALLERADRLELELENLKVHNAELCRQMEDIKAGGEQASELSERKQEIIRRIDRMLEKFGELRI